MNKLLVVEDEIMTSDLLRRYFELVGYSVVTALTGAEAIRKAVEHQPSVVILDIMLPDMDGYQVCRRLRSDPRTDQIPIIFLTQKDDRRDRLDGLGLGADDYITKPFDVEELRLRVSHITDRGNGPAHVDSRASLPNMDLIKERLPRLLKNPNLVYVDVQILNFWDYDAQYGQVASSQVIRSMGKLIGDLLYEVDHVNAFVGHPREDHFLLVFPKASFRYVKRELHARFGQQVARFYDYPDQQRGLMRTENGFVSFMSLKLMRIPPKALMALVGMRVEVGAEDEASQNTPRRVRRPLLGGRKAAKWPALPAPDSLPQSEEWDY